MRREGHRTQPFIRIPIIQRSFIWIFVCFLYVEALSALFTSFFFMVRYFAQTKWMEIVSHGSLVEVYFKRIPWNFVQFTTTDKGPVKILSVLIHFLSFSTHEMISFYAAFSACFIYSPHPFSIFRCHCCVLFHRCVCVTEFILHYRRFPYVSLRFISETLLYNIFSVCVSLSLSLYPPSPSGNPEKSKNI